MHLNMQRLCHWKRKKSGPIEKRYWPPATEQEFQGVIEWPARIISEEHVTLHDCGEMNVICGECGAKHFKEEKPQDKKFTQCCKKGRVILPRPKECPEPLAKLMQNDHPKTKRFMQKIRNYNSAHDFASMGAQISSPPGRGPYCFRIHGQVYHQTTQVGPTEKPKNADLYYMDAAQVSEFRANLEANVGCRRDLMEELDAMLREKNHTRQFTK